MLLELPLKRTSNARSFSTYIGRTNRYSYRDENITGFSYLAWFFEHHFIGGWI